VKQCHKRNSSIPILLKSELILSPTIKFLKSILQPFIYTLINGRLYVSSIIFLWTSTLLNFFYQFANSRCRLQGSDETVQNLFVDKWIGAHIQDSNTVLGKPIIIAEFGKSSKSAGYNIDKRDVYFNKVYNAISTSAINGGSCAGGIFWQLLSQGMDNMGDSYEVVFENSPSTSQVIKQQSLKMSSIKK